MKPYSELTMRGRLRRLRALAETAIANYDLKQPEISYYTFDTNLLYQVTTAAGERYMLRMASPDWRTFEDLQAEALWLAALERDTDIPAPRIIPARSGEYVLPMSRPDIPKIWNASLMSWVPGRLLGHYLTEGNLQKMGELFAKLHRHGASWTPPTGFTTRRFEHWISREEVDRLFGDSPVANLVEVTAPTWQLFVWVHQQVESAYASLDRADLRVIHCDLWHDNIKLHKGVLYPLDFEDTVWGFRAHDIAMAMLDLLESTDDVRYPVLLAAFRRGYEELMAWPEDPIEVFQMGRLLWKVNWVANYQPQRLIQMVENHIPVFKHYMQQGSVIRPPVGL